MALSAVLAVLLSVGPSRAVVFPLRAGEGVSEKTAEALGESVAAELRRQGRAVMTREEVAQVLTLERQKALLGCESDGCVVELAGALDVDQIYSGSVAQLGTSWVVHLKLIDARSARTLAQSDQRLKGGSVDDVLDALPQLVRALLGQGPQPAVASERPAPAPAPAPASGGARPGPSFADEPFAPALDKGRLKLVTDGKGRYLAFTPFGGTSAPLFAGDGQSFWAQRVFGGGSSGNTAFDLAFWEPRFSATSTFAFREGKYTLWCGRTEVPLTEVRGKDAAKLLGKARFLEPRWRRKAHALARDDEGSYVYVDAPRDGVEGPFHVYRGPKGAVKGEAAKTLSADSAGEVLGLWDGKLRLDAGKKEAALLRGSERTPLTWLPLEPNVVLVYQALGAYEGQALGTACDGVSAAR